jgi:hypothetical protein
VSRPSQEALELEGSVGTRDKAERDTAQALQKIQLRYLKITFKFLFFWGEIEDMEMWRRRDSF